MLAVVADDPWVHPRCVAQVVANGQIVRVSARRARVAYVGTLIEPLLSTGSSAAIADHGAEPGSQVNARDRNQVTPLMLAVDRLRQQAVAELLARGADPNLKAADGASAVSLAFESQAKAPELMLTIILRTAVDPMRTLGKSALARV